MNPSIIGQSPSSPEPAEAVVPSQEPSPTVASKPDAATDLAVEVGGRDGPEPTRYGDWEKNGRCIDF
ncbi:DUF1674 domain-containing protein [Thermomonas carbonis]|uniref:DUF1674 domain-containing protein n=1 Tax=Thermomonas carbonis TaxID=1463158 RepID=UPI0019843D7F|nr:DUF1674 domain-containing protein [Thermomonas carbonis]GHC05894.1 hypothetical protein GCM10010080_19790 [Thermomonas carbonis]